MDLGSGMIKFNLRLNKKKAASPKLQAPSLTAAQG